MSNARLIAKLHPLAQYVTELLGIAQQGGLPTGSLVDYTSTTLPDGFIWADGATLTAGTPHQALRNLYINDGFPHGQDGSGNPKVPDARGRVTAAPDNLGGVAAGRLSVGALGAAGGVESVTLTSAQSGSPAHSHTASSNHSLATSSAGSHTHNVMQGGGSEDSFTGIQVQHDYGGANPVGDVVQGVGDHTHAITGSISTTVNASSASSASQAHTNVQPTLVLNKIIKT